MKYFVKCYAKSGCTIFSDTFLICYRIRKRNETLVFADFILAINDFISPENGIYCFSLFTFHDFTITVNTRSLWSPWMYFVLALSSKALSSLVYLATFLLVVVVGIKTSSPHTHIFRVLFYFLVNVVMKNFFHLWPFSLPQSVIHILLIFYLYILKLSFLRKIAD